jgi:predicted nucleic acid-binding protein
VKLVLDASVAIASIRPGEPDYAAARARVDRALQGADELLEPAIFRIEVGGALVRRGRQEAEIRRLVDPLCAPPHAIVTIGPKRAAAAEALAIRARLRGADAVYVWLASSRGLPLCTLDHEMAERAAAFCNVISP